MRSLKDFHLDETCLIKAVVDEADLAQSHREHLAQCHECRKRKEAIEENLVRLSQQAEQFSPSPRRKISLPVETRRKSWSWQWRTAIGAAVAAVFIGVVWAPALFKKPAGLDEPSLAPEVLEAKEFMIEISRLTENALPEEYLMITGDTDDELDEEVDDEFLEFMVPSVEDEFWSHDSGRNGGKQC